MIILVINAGSSSIKYQLFDMANVSLLRSGQIERIGEWRSKARNHKAAVKILIEELTDPEKGCVKSIGEISAIGHRVVHGGEEFTESILLNGDIVGRIEKYNELAPLHNPPAISVIVAFDEILKDIKQVAVFDTAFYQTMSPHAYLYALPLELYEKYRIRRYGFHGTSHRYVAREAAAKLNRPQEELKLITCHLGNGCSITAEDKGKPVDTSMGFTPLEGLVMGTRAGDIDPAIVFFLMGKEKLNPRQISELLNKQSGLLGLSGVSNDMRDIKPEADKGNERAKKAIDIFIYRIKKYIGAYIAAMDGIDAVVLTAGIGENQPFIKTQLEKELENLRTKLGFEILVIPTNEELLIAQDTYEIARGPRGS